MYRKGVAEREPYRMTNSHGTGEFSVSQFARLGEDVVFENGVLVFHPENIEIGSGVYVGHCSILKGYYNEKMVVGDGTWIGQQCFFHSAGGLWIGRNVGIGPGVKIITSSHKCDDLRKPILHNEVVFSPVTIEDDCDIGTGAVVLPGTHIGHGVQIGAGAVVNSDMREYAIAAGVPAREIGTRN